MLLQFFILHNPHAPPYNLHRMSIPLWNLSLWYEISSYRSFNIINMCSLIWGNQHQPRSPNYPHRDRSSLRTLTFPKSFFLWSSEQLLIAECFLSIYQDWSLIATVDLCGPYNFSRIEISTSSVLVQSTKSFWTTDLSPPLSQSFDPFSF